MKVVQGVVGGDGKIDQVEVDNVPESVSRINPDVVKQIAEGVYELVHKGIPNGDPYDFSDIPLPHEISRSKAAGNDGDIPLLPPTLNDLMGDYSEPFFRTNWDEETLTFIVKPLKLKQVKAIAYSIRIMGSGNEGEVSALEANIEQLCAMAVNILRVVDTDNSTGEQIASRRATLDEIESYFEASELNTLIMQYTGTKLTSGGDGLPNL